MEQATAIVLVAADASVGAQVGGDSADVAEDAEVDGIAAEVMGVSGATSPAVAGPAAACGVDAQAAEPCGNLMYDATQSGVEAAAAGAPADTAATAR